MKIKLITWFTFLIAAIIIVCSIILLFYRDIYDSNIYDSNIIITNYDNEGILGICIGMLVGYIGIIKNKPDIYEMEYINPVLNSQIDLNGTKIIISKFNDITDTIEKIFPNKKFKKDQLSQQLQQGKEEQQEQKQEREQREQKQEQYQSALQQQYQPQDQDQSSQEQLAKKTGSKSVVILPEKVTHQYLTNMNKFPIKHSSKLIDLLRKTDLIDDTNRNDTNRNDTNRNDTNRDDTNANGQRQLINLFDKFEPMKPKKISRVALDFPKQGIPPAKEDQDNNGSDYLDSLLSSSNSNS